MIHIAVAVAAVIVLSLLGTVDPLLPLIALMLFVVAITIIEES